MQIQVLLFASYADAFGTPALQVTLPEDATVGDLLGCLHGLSAGAALPPAPLVAVNQRYAKSAQRILPHDEVAIIPPVAGG